MGQSSGGNSGGSLGDIFNDMLKNGPMGQMGGVNRWGQMRESRPADPSPYDEPGCTRKGEISTTFTGDENMHLNLSRKRQGYPKGTGLEDLFGDLFKPTKQGVPQYDKAIESIFDQFLKPRR